jgi:cyclohexadienyl dehydratase
MSHDIVTSKSSPKSPPLTGLLLAVAVLALVGLFFPRPQVGSAPERSSALTQIAARQTLRIGYEGYPPYTITDPATQKLSGFSVDLAEELAREAGWKVEWVKTSPETKVPDLEAGKFDLMTEPIFRTIPRATRVTFSRPYAYFADAVGVVKKGDQRFKSIDDLNHSEVKIAVRQGYTDQQFAKDNLPEATVRALKVDDASQIFLEVMLGRADVVLTDLEQAKAFVAAHSDEVELRFNDPAPAYIPAGFMLRQGDFALYNFVNSSLDYLEANGALTRLNKKYGITPTTPPGR